MQTFTFRLTGEWSGGRNGEGRVETDGLQTAVSVPADMHGPGVGTNPDELLLAAAANCYMITLAAILERKALNVASIGLTSEGVVTLDLGKLKYTRIVHRPVLVMEGATPEQQDQAAQAAHLAEKACMISQALRGNVEITVEPEVR